MRVPAIKGVIDRRVLVNYRVDAEAMRAVVPEPFRPALVDGWAIGGICLIRLKRVRPRFSPLPWGLTSENAAHRIAVEWDLDGERREGVYVPRRDTDSWLNVWAGGALFPGKQHHARFQFEESDQRVSVEVASDDGEAGMAVLGSVGEFRDESIFPSLRAASDFFERGALGYSDTSKPRLYDGLELRCKTWSVEPLAVERVSSSFFEDRSRFPDGTVEFDCALLMRGIEHEWHGRENLCCPSE